MESSPRPGQCVPAAKESHSTAPAPFNHCNDEISFASAGSSSRAGRAGPRGHVFGSWTRTQRSPSAAALAALKLVQMCGRGKENCLECGTQSAPSTEQVPKNAKPWDMSHTLEFPCSLLWNGFATTQVVTRVKTTTGHWKWMCCGLFW